jgi:hypothetical protein
MPKLKHIREIPSRYARPDPAKLAAAGKDPKSVQAARKAVAWKPARAGLQILEILYEYRYLTADMLALIYDAANQGGFYTVRSLVTKLWRAGFIERHFRPAPEYGSSQFVYTLTIKGARTVIPSKDWPSEAKAMENLARHKSNYEHALSTSLVRLLWNLGCDQFAETFTTEEIWRDLEGDAEHTRNEFIAEVDGREVPVRPDTTVLIAHQKRDYNRPIFFEIQRTHRNLARLRQRLLAYEYLLSAEGEHVVQDVFERELGIVPSRGMAVYIAATEHDAQRLRDFAAGFIHARTELWFSSLDKLTERRPKRRKDGSLYLRQRSGFPDAQPVPEAVPISPTAFFRENLFTALDGKIGKLIIALGGLCILSIF